MDFEKLLEEAAGKKLAGKKKQLQSSYDQSLADLAELEQGAAQQAREAATRRTVEAKQDRAAWNEIQTAQGLTSGAQSQALLAMDNQLRGDLTAIANTRDSATAELARKRQALARDLAQRAELLGAIRLPNDAFKKNAGAEVVSDIIFLQKRDRPLDIVPEWTQTGQTEGGFAINRYFIDRKSVV